MGNPTIIDRLRDWIGRLGWDLFIWANYGGKEQVYHIFRDQDAFITYGVPEPKELQNKLNNLP